MCGREEKNRGQYDVAVGRAMNAGGFPAGDQPGERGGLSIKESAGKQRARTLRISHRKRIVNDPKLSCTTTRGLRVLKRTPEARKEGTMEADKVAAKNEMGDGEERI